MSTATSKIPLPVVCLFGPTAVGKTALLEELFKGSGEIVSADSMQVYRRLDIGTAKPDKAALAALPHHLIDIADYRSQFNAGDFVKRADRAVRDIAARGLLPVISGGTAFYFRNFLYGLPEIPGIPPEIRAELTRRKEREGLAVLQEELARVDPPSAARIEKTDAARIIRALEVWQGTGRPLSSFPLPERPRGEFRCLMLGLRRDREELYRRIDRRVDIMFDQGLKQEVFALLAEGARFSDPGMKGIGYSEFAGLTENGCLTLGDVRERIKRDSRRYAKRQMTFFRSLPGVEWFHPEEEKGAIRERVALFRREAAVE